MNKKDMSSKINDLLIMKEGENHYFLFGSYNVLEDDLGFKITKSTDDPVYFSDLKSAVAWCVFDKNKKSSYIKRLIELDIELSSLNVSIYQHKKLLKKAREIEDKYIYLAKLEEEKVKFKKLNEELKSYISTSKAWQQKKYSENLSYN